MTKLLFVRLFEKESKVDVFVEDKTGRKRMVTFVWKTKDPTPIPASWFQQVEAELRYQDSQALAKSKGRNLF